MKKIVVVVFCYFSIATVSALTCTDLPKNLSKGMENSEVLKLQNFLFDKGYLKAKPNGYYGVGTVAAVKAYQKSVFLSQVGVVGIGTRGMIKKESCVDLNLNRTTSKQLVKVAEATSSTFFSSSENEMFIEIGNGYYNIDLSKAVKINDKLAYSVLQKEGNSIIVYDNKEIGNFAEGEDPQLLEIDGKLVFITYKNRSGYNFVYYGGQEIGSEYFGVKLIAKINNKLAFTACKEKTCAKKVVVYDGKEIAESYDDIESLVDINGKLAFLVKNESKYFVVYEGKQSSQNYDFIAGLANINGKVAFAANDKHNYFIVYDGQELRKGFTSVGGPVEKNHKLTYISEDPITFFESVIYDGQKIGEGYQYIKSISEINNKLIFTAVRENNNKIFTVYDGKEIGNEYDSIKSPTGVNGKLVYIANKDKKYFTVYDGQKFGKEYDFIFDLIEANGKIIFTASRGADTFYVIDGVEIKLENHYGFIRPLYLKNNNTLIFIAFSQEGYLITGPGMESKDFYYFLGIPRKINGKIAFVAQKNKNDNKSFIIMEK